VRRSPETGKPVVVPNHIDHMGYVEGYESSESKSRTDSHIGREMPFRGGGPSETPATLFTGVLRRCHTASLTRGGMSSTVSPRGSRADKDSKALERRQKAPENETAEQVRAN
jgi:hypothetical protein